MKCLICENKNVNFLSDYKLEIEADASYFKGCKIYRCNDCDFSFVSPMPSKEGLNFFYENIYRSLNRPPYWLTENYKDMSNSYLDDRNINYLLYASLLIDFKDVKSIYDFGAGHGDLGHSLKKKFPHLELFCTENDKHCLPLLKERHFNNIQDISNLENKFDLIITLHSLEHLDSINIFENFRKILRTNGRIFFEVPNCPSEYFDGRPYDGPHLLFYTHKSFQKIAKKYNFEIQNFDFASYSFEEDHKHQREAKKLYNQINQKKLNFEKFKKILKKIIPYNLIKLRQKLLQANKLRSSDRINNFAFNTGNNCYIRGILKKLD
tara:strand:+ start:5790 stop:6755 length:966 start_codon:yes stop_codon:yes gene_type:complete